MSYYMSVSKSKQINELVPTAEYFGLTKQFECAKDPMGSNVEFRQFSMTQKCLELKTNKEGATG